MYLNLTYRSNNLTACLLRLHGPKKAPFRTEVLLLLIAKLELVGRVLNVSLAADTKSLHWIHAQFLFLLIVSSCPRQCLN